ncbi:MAG: DUF2808 domain-containing protein [Cyanobacteria bacterium P01_D01_bin.6]
MLKLWNQKMGRRLLLVFGFASAIGLSTAGLPTTAVQLGDGTTAFNSPPRLVDFVTLDTYTDERRPTYYVTVNLLPEAGESLETLTVSLIEGRFTRLNYRTDDIRVFAGTRRDRGTEHSVAAADFDDEAQTLTIRLAEPAEPGQVLTFTIDLVRNPRWEGVYLYEVTVAPAGDSPRFQRIGTGRIHIYQREFIFFD